MIRLNREQVLRLHRLALEETGGMPGLRDNSLLDSALNSPFQTFENRYLYPSLEMQAARLAFSLIKNHPFIDGNKRIGVLVMLTFLELNGEPLHCTDAELIDIGLRLADGAMSDCALLQWILQKTSASN